MDLRIDQKLMIEALTDARKVQEFIWGELSLSHRDYNPEAWRRVFQKRVDAIARLDLSNPSAKAELRKRILQQAALSIAALAVLEKEAKRAAEPHPAVAVFKRFRAALSRYGAAVISWIA